MKKKIFALVFSFIFMFTLFPAAVFAGTDGVPEETEGIVTEEILAGEEDPTEEVIMGDESLTEETYEVQSEEEITPVVLPAAEPSGKELSGNLGSYTISESGSYYLSGDATGNITIADGKDVTLDLNGHVLKSDVDGTAVITIGQTEGSSATLTIKDSNPSATHTDDYESLPAGGVITGAGPDEKNGIYALTGGGVKNLGTFIMLGGTITGNDAGEYNESQGVNPCGGGVYNGGTMTVGNTATITGNTYHKDSYDLADNLYLPTGSTVNIDNDEHKPAARMNIGITTQTAPAVGTPVVFTSEAINGNETHFFSDSENYAVWFNSDSSVLELRVVVASITDSTGKTTKYETVQAALNAAQSGQTVKLVADCTESVSVESENQASGITLDLNGHVFKAEEDYVITVADVTLTLKDSNPDSIHTDYETITGGIITGGSSGLYIAGTINMYGGTIANNSGNGGGVYIERGCFNLYGGTICNNTNTGSSGGGVNVGSVGIFNMYGGSITGNKANAFIGTSGCGGGVYNNGTFNMYGGTISGNTAKRLGGGVYNNGTMTVGGTAKITGNTKNSSKANNLYLPSGKTITIGTKTGSSEGNGVPALTSGASIGVTLADVQGQFTSNGTENDEQYFFSDNAAYMVSFNDSSTYEYLELTEKKVCKIGNTKYKTIAAALAAAHEDEDENNPTVITMIADDEENVTIPTNRFITLDLNGHVIQGTGNGSVIYIAGERTQGAHDANNKLTITDSNTSAKHYFKYSTNGAWSLDTSASSGIDVSEITSSTEENTVIEIKGGVITGGNNSGNGGGISVGISSKLVMAGGTICGNTAKQGGGLYTGNTVTVTLSDAAIVGNHATDTSYGFGGALLNAHNSSFKFGGVVKIFANTATTYNNLTLWDAVNGAPITIDENNKLAEGSKIILQFGYNPSTGVGAFTTNGTENDVNYFASDSLIHKVKFVDATTEPASAAHLELVNYDINAVASNTTGITLENDAMTVAQAEAVAKAQKPNSGLSRETIIAYAKAEDNNKYKTIKADKNNDWAASDDMTLAEMKAALSGDSSKDVFVIGTVVNHTHSWTYSTAKSVSTLAYDDTITASCGNEGCKATDTTLVITASDETYDGNAHGAILKSSKDAASAAESFCGDTTLPKISYEQKNGESWDSLSAEPKAAGTYRAGITVGSKTAYVEFTIAKRQLTISTEAEKKTTVSNKTYDGKTTASAEIGKVEGIVENEKVTVAIDSAAFVDKNAGTGKTVTVTYKLSGDDAGNYTAPENDTASADISPKQLTISTEAGEETTVSDKTYDGNKAASATIGTVEGIVENDKVTVEITSATFSDKNAGESKAVTVIYDISGDDADNYTKPENETISAKITAKTINVAADDKTSYVGSELEKLTYRADELVSGDTFTGALSTSANKNVVKSCDILQGSLAVNDGNNGNNYTINYTKGTYTVTDKEIQTLAFAGVTEGKVTKTYGDAAFTEAVTGAETAVTYSSSNEKVATVDSSGKVTILSAGTAIITANAAESYKYAPASAQYELTVAQKQLTVTGTSADGKGYDGTTTAEAHIGTVSGICSGDEKNMTVAVQSATFNNKNAGNGKTVTVIYSISGSAAGNYIAPANDETKADIEKKSVNVTAENKTTYVGSDLAALTYIAGDLIAGDSWTGALATQADKSKTGTYDILQGSLTVSDGNNGKNYTINYTKGTYTVTAKEVQTLAFAGVTEGKVTKTYGDAAFTEAVTGAETSVTYSSSDEAVATVDVKTGKVTILRAGSAVIKATAEETAKYAAGLAQYVLNVSKIKIDVPEAKTGFVYNGKDQTGVVLPDGALYTLTDNVKKDAGTYTAVASLKDKANYEWNLEAPSSADQSISWSIVRAKVTVTAENKEMLLGEKVPEFTAKVTGLVGTDTVKYSFNTLNPDSQGMYSIVPAGDAVQGNYDVTYVQGVLAVSKKESNAKADTEDVAKVLEKYQKQEEYKGKTLDVEVRTDEKVPETNKEMVTKQVASGKKLQFTETNLILIVKAENDTSEKNIGDENDILISVTYKFDFTNKKDLQVFRVHEKADKSVVVDELTEKANADGEYVSINREKGEITVTAKKYSTFAVAYNETASVPGTGDSNNAWLYVLISALALGAVCVAVAGKKANR